MSDDLRELLSGDVLRAARGLLGRLLSTDVACERTSVIVTEVEAYGGSDDPASHAYRGRSPRNASMFDGPGTLYVYRSYGIHWCANVVTGPRGEASAVLLRGATPVEGVDVMRRRRGRDDALVDGPGKLAQALAITGDHDGGSIFAGPVSIGSVVVSGSIAATPRIGVTRARDRPWRLVLT